MDIDRNAKLAAVLQLKAQYKAEQSRFVGQPLLISEMPHPQTLDLSNFAQHDLEKAIGSLIACDISACLALINYKDQLERFQRAILNALNEGRKIFMVGCGASGRLALLLQTLASKSAHKPLNTKIKGIIAGGESALVRSVEQFEDSTKLAKAQLLAHGFSKHDLLIGLSASGESPFILQALNFASTFCDTSPWLICNNPKSLLHKRNNANYVLKNPQIKTLCLDIGPMALTGSTRMQATTVMMLALGLAIFYPKNIFSPLQRFTQHIKSIHLAGLVELIKQEAALLKAQKTVIYEAPAHLALNVLTDTTERSPTFNLRGFHNQEDKPLRPSACYLMVTDSDNAQNAWHKILNRPPFALNWPDYPQTTAHFMQGFDFSPKSVKILTHNGAHFLLQQDNDHLIFSLAGNHLSIPTLKEEFLDQVLLKSILNIHSTLVMGRLGYYHGNMMSSLAPANCKLIDRAIRYTKELAKLKHNVSVSYEQAEKAVLSAMPKLKENESIVELSLGRLLSVRSV